MDAGYIEIKNWFTLSGLDDIDYKVGGTVVIDGIMLDYGFETAYMPYDPLTKGRAVRKEWTQDE